MDAAPLAEYDERRRMASRLQVAWPGLLVLTLASAPALHQLGLGGLLLVVGPAIVGLLLTLAVVLQARRLRPRVAPVVSSEAALPVTPSQAA